MGRMTTETTPAPEAVCDKVRDPFKDVPEFAGKLAWTCDRPAGHRKSDGHRFVNDKGQTTFWRGADNE